MKSFLYFFCLFLCFSRSGYGQKTLSGTIIDQTTGKPLTAVTVQLLPLQARTLTDENGRYAFGHITQQKLFLQLSHVGYVTLTDSIELTHSLIRDYSLVPSAQTLQEVQVAGNAQNGYRNEQAQAGLLGSLPIKDIPYSLNVTSGELIENRSAHTLSDALQTNPTAALLMSSNTYSSLSRMMIRGFTAADQSELRDGMVDRSFTFPHLENVERIEVLNGLSSFLYGFSAIGGTINYVSKQPTATPLASFALGSYGNGIKYLQADLGGPATADGRLGYRVNAYREDGKTYIKDGQQQRTLLSAVFDYRLGKNTHLKADITQQDYTVQGLQTYFALAANATGVPDAFDPAKQYGQPWTYNESKKTQLGLGITSQLSQTFRFRAAFRYNEMWRKYNYISAKLLAEGSYQETYWDSPRQTQNTHSGYAYIDANFNTGSIQHTVTVGYNSADYLYKRGLDLNVVLGTSTLANPESFTVPAYAAAQTTFQSQLIQNGQLSDRIVVNDTWQAILGLTYASLQQKAGGLFAGISTSNFTQTKLTPSIAVVFKPGSSMSFYGSYMQGLSTGGTAPATVRNANQQLGPSVSDQYEIGAKSTIGRMDITAALFRINKINEYIDPADTVYKQDGREVHEGIEVTTTGKLTPRLTLVGGFTLMKATITKAANNPALEHKIPINVPQQQIRMYLEYSLPWVSGLIVTGSGNYFGQRPIDNLNTLFLPGVTTVDAGLRYQLSFLRHKAGIQLNVANLLNKAYWANFRAGDGLQLGTPRLTSFGVKLNL